MSQVNNRKLIANAGLPLVVLMAAAMLAAPAGAATPGITGGAGTPQFSLSAEAAFISQPDGLMVYSWGYGCQAQPDGFAPAAIAAPTGGCPSMQIPGPTLIVKEGDLVKVTLTNNLPAAAGNTSILFPGFSVTATGGETGLLTQEAAPGGSVTYTFDTTGKAGTHSYYSGTQGDLQIEMGLYGAIVVLPATSTGCIPVSPTLPDGQTDYRLAASAYDHSMTCYEREYLFQFSEIDPAIHRQAEDQKDQACMSHAGCMNVRTENYHPAYFMINGRSMPDDMDPVYAVQYAHQPYNGNPHMHPGELVLLRIIGQGRWQHPFHEHGNHVRVLARDGNLLESIADPNMLAGPLLFTTTTTPGQAMDGIFYWTGKGLNWDVYGHKLSSVPCVTDANCPAIPSGQKCVTGLCDPSPCTPDADGYYTGKPNPIDHATVALKPNYYEWCGDHNRALEAHPAGDVGSGGPITLPDAGILANGPWYGGSPYLGPDAAARAVGPTPIPPSGTVANDPGSEAGFAFMWHSHNEREITTNNAFPGGMLMMMLVDPQAFPIDESK